MALAVGAASAIGSSSVLLAKRRSRTRVARLKGRGVTASSGREKAEAEKVRSQELGTRLRAGRATRPRRRRETPEPRAPGLGVA